MSTLATIRTKVRRLTGRFTSSKITDSQIDEAVNTFLLYDLPQELQIFSLKGTYEFITTSNVADYNLLTETVDVGQGATPVMDYYTALEPPAYIAGYQVDWFQDKTSYWRTTGYRAQELTLTGDGTVGPYTFTFDSAPVLQGTVTVGCVDNTGATYKLIDVPSSRTTGTWDIINTQTSVGGSINYLTGAGTITFVQSIPSGNTITIQGIPYAASRPNTIFFYDNTLSLYPVPDKEYLVQIEAQKQPLQLLASGSSPQLKQWWQYIAYGAAKKIFEDSQDIEGVRMIMPEFKKQEIFVLRRTVIQNASQRVKTLYSDALERSNSANLYWY